MFDWLFGKKELPEIENESRDLLVNKYSYQLDLSKKGKTLFQHLHITRAEGFNDFTILTQTWHESGRYEKVIGNFNYWGIKKPKNWEGEVIKVRTHEYDSEGKKVPVFDDFIDFKDCSSAVIWWISLIQRLYKGAYQHRDNPELFFDGLIKGGEIDSEFSYATDPIYVSKLTNLYLELKQNDLIKKLLEVV